MDQIEDRLVLCKIITSIKSYIGDKPFNKSVALIIIIRTVKLKKSTPRRIREYEAVSLSREQASRIFSIMTSLGYIEFSHFHNPPPGYPTKVPRGEKMYKVGELRLAECMETSWFKGRQRKEKFVKKERKIDTRSCRALQQIYTMYSSTPFSYNMVTETAKMITKLGQDPNVQLNKAEKVALQHMKAKLYGFNPDSFREVWQSLLRNGYILPHKIKTPDGYIKTTGLYKINQAYLKHCLAELA